MTVFRWIYSIVVQLIVFGGLLFLPAGTLHWWRAWVFVAVAMIAGVASIIGLSSHQDLLDERFKGPIQQGQPLADKIITVLFLLSYLGLIVFIPLDVFRFHLMSKPGPVVSSLGLVLFVAGWWIIFLGLRENAFAVPVVKLQKGRGQRVVDTGIYSVIRHPIYVGGILLMVGMSLWLESFAAVLLAIVPSGLLVLRIVVEENLLRRELTGYDDYVRRVRYRLIPFVW